MLGYTDQLGNELRLAKKPQRIVSLVPSQSELLWDLGLREELVGITKFCVHPQQLFSSTLRVGGTKKLDMDKIRALAPDVIIGNKEENERAQIEVLQAEFPVWMSDIYTFEDIFGMIRSMGEIFDKQTIAANMILKLQTSLSCIKNYFVKQQLAYFIWNAPYMFAARNTFIDHVLTHVGFENALSAFDRYPSLDNKALQSVAPEICFLSSEPFPFKDKHVKALQKILPHTKILIVDGEVFSWYGSRLLHLEEYLNKLAKHHPELLNR